MGISTNALITAPELKKALGGGFVTETKHDETIADVCNDVSDTIERYLDRHVVTRGNITAYFTAPCRTCDLYFREWPLISVTSVHEDSTRAYASTALLVANTDYVVSAPPDRYGYITRTPDATSGPSYWLTGWRAVKVVYAAGYANTAAVPAALKTVARQLGVTTFREWQKANPQAVSDSNAMGTMTYSPFSAAFLTEKMMAALQAGGFKRPELFWDYEARVA